MQNPIPLTRDLVLIGGGHAHALVLRRFGMRPVPGLRITLVNPGPTAPYTGMLPGHVAGHYTREELEIDLVRLARFAGTRLVLDRATGLDRDRREVHLAGRAPLRYDLLSLDIGITGDLDIPGFAEHGLPAKPLERFATAWEAFVAAPPPTPRIAVIGGGVAGCELALAMAHRLRGAGISDVAVTVLEARAEVLNELAPGARQRILAQMRDYGIEVETGVTVEAVEAGGLRLAGGRTMESDLTVGAAGAQPQGWLAETGLELRDGYVVVDAQLRSPSDPRIFAAGDCAHLRHAPRPKAGVYAVRAAPVLAWNLRADLTGRQRRAFRPQRDFLRLISLGGKRALAQKWGTGPEGDWVWRWKDRIDRKFMDGFATLPRMAAPAPPKDAAIGAAAAAAGQPPCAGCGAKIGPGALQGALAGLAPPLRPDVRAAPGDDAAVLRVGGETQVITTDHLRGFTLDPWLLAQVAAHHALGDIWAMGAQPQAALASITLPHMAPAMQQATLAEIMTAAQEVFRAAGADIAGGHSTLGAELSIGFTVTGLAGARPIGLDGARAGDALVLSAPIGSGTLLAAEMALKARGTWIGALWEAMTRGQAQAAAILAPEARAMTDVTGFGLAGHLMNMMRASGTGARLELAAVPVFDGAEAMAAAGVRSTLYAENRAALGDAVLPDTPRAALLSDPQTGGGLLAAVPADAAQALVGELEAAGYRAARIGTVIETAGRLEIA